MTNHLNILLTSASPIQPIELLGLTIKIYCPSLRPALKLEVTVPFRLLHPNFGGVVFLWSSLKRSYSDRHLVQTGSKQLLRVSYGTLPQNWLRCVCQQLSCYGVLLFVQRATTVFTVFPFLFSVLYCSLRACFRLKALCDFVFAKFAIYIYINSTYFSGMATSIVGL